MAGLPTMDTPQRRKNPVVVRVVVVLGCLGIGLLAALQVHFYGSSLTQNKSVGTMMQSLAKHTGVSTQVLSDTLDNLRGGGSSARVGPLKITLEHESSTGYVATLAAGPGCEFNAEVETVQPGQVRIRVTCPEGGVAVEAAAGEEVEEEETVEAVEVPEEEPEEVVPVSSPPPPPPDAPPPSPPPAPKGPVWMPDDEGMWEDCDTCDGCQLGPPPDRPWPAGVTRLPRRPPGPKHCRRCYGCNVILSRLPDKEDFQGKTKKVFTGASGTAVMVGKILDDRGKEKEVIVKVWCGLKGGYRHTELHEKIPETCPPLTDTSRCPMTGGMFGQGPCNQMFQNALMSIIDDAGLAHVTPRTWSGHAKSFIPATSPYGGARQRVDTVVQYYDKAPGVAVEALTQGVANKESVTTLNKARPEHVMAAATFDLLFSERDRHGQNVFIDTDGNLQLIDNEGIYGPINSMFFPGNQKFEIYRVGYNAVCCGNLPGGPLKPGNCPGKPIASSVEVFLDYRCFAPGGKIGFDFPPGVMDFLRKIAKFTPPQIQNMYRLTHLVHAKVIKQRTTDMLEVGFEGAMERAYSRQPRGDGIQYGFNFSYPIHDACCKLDQCDIRNKVGV